MATTTIYPNSTKTVKQHLTYEDFKNDPNASNANVTLLADVAAPTERPIRAEVRVLSPFTSSAMTDGELQLVDADGDTYATGIDAEAADTGLHSMENGSSLPDNMQAQQYGAKLILTGDTVQNLTGGELVINWEVQNGYSE